MSIAYIQPIFAPNENQLERNIKSIKSFGEYVKKYEGINQIILGGYAKDEYWNNIKQTINESIGHLNPKIIEYGRNYGKATIVNSLSQFIKSNISYILTADSDIIYSQDQPNMFRRLLNATTVLENVRNQKVGLIALNQLETNFHLPMAYENVFTYQNIYNQEEKITWPNGRGGIAGGCLFITLEGWRAIGGYRVYGVYAGDDAYALIDLCDNNYSIQLINTLSVIHPNETDQGYAAWKNHICQRDSGCALENFEDKIQEAEIFWNTRS